MEASRLDVFGTFLKTLREYEHEGESRLPDEVNIALRERSEAVRRMLLNLRDASEPVPAPSLLVWSDLPSDEFAAVLQALVTAGFVLLTFQPQGAAVELTDQGRTAAAVL